MRKFLQRALEKFSKLDEEQIRNLLFGLAKENDRLETVLDSMTDGVIVTDPDHAIIYKNKSSERLFPFKSGEHGEKILWQVIEDEEIATFMKYHLSSHESVEDKEFTLDTSGRNRTLSCSILPLVRDGKISGNLFHIEDVTEKRSKEARLRRAENLASLTTLAAGVAHEIKNPLGSIGIHIQLLQKAMGSLGDLDRESMLHYLDIVNEEVERLNGIIVDFLFAVRPMDIHLEKVNIHDIVHDLMDFLHFELEAADVEYREEFDPEIPELNIDVKYMKQALLNIVKNAVAAMDEGGLLTMATEQRNNMVNLSIKDNGVGITDEALSKIFEPYFTTKDFGSGLGLTLVYKIVKEHSGEIAVQSKIGVGTTFTISLPVPQTEQHLIGWKDEDDEV